MRILIGLIEHLGDIVACEPVTRHLKAEHPSASLSWVVLPRYRELVDTNPQIDTVVVVECLTDWIKLTRHGDYDKIVDLHVNYRVCEHCRIPLYKTSGNPLITVWEAFEYGSILEAFSLGAGLPKLSGQPQVYIRETHVANVDRLIDRLKLGDRFCVIHRTSNSIEKDWREPNWRRLIEWLIHDEDLTVVEVGAGPPAAGPVSYEPRHVSLYNATAILEDAEIIRRASVFIGVDSGPAHLANAVKTPGVILLGRIGTYRQYSPFSGYYASSDPGVKLVRNLTGPAAEIAVNEVVEAVKYVLQASQRAPEHLDSAAFQHKPATAGEAGNIGCLGALVGKDGRDCGLRSAVADAGTGSKPTVSRNGSDDATTFPRVLAFYLPQFHPIPENDHAHGMGFTEWHNVIAAKPLFRGHYQPRLPGELGFYDLRAPDVVHEQTRLAGDYGISGFCFYYYYFNGKRLLYTPISNYIKSSTKMPFCFLWANENWTKRWDGGNQEVIIRQEHSAIDDLNFIRQLVPVFTDDRYIKINGKPLLLIYKISLFPDILQTTEIWRREIERAGFPGLYLVMVDDWGPIDHPRVYGFDASYEIPSNLIHEEVCLPNREYDVVDDFVGKIVDYRRFASFHLGRPAPTYKRFRTVMLPWDNTARYRNRAIVHINTDNDSYKTWLTTALIDSYSRFLPEERIVFIHSWNEWCEGTYLEPDGRSGRRFLEETRQAVSGARQVIDLIKDFRVTPEAALLLERVSLAKEEGLARVAKIARDSSAWALGEAGRLRAELEAVRATLDAVHESTSWRITAPLRWVKLRLLSRQLSAPTAGG